MDRRLLLLSGHPWFYFDFAGFVTFGTTLISKTLGPKNPDVPAFVAIGQTVEGAGEIGTLKAFHTAGFLGSEYGPFLIPEPMDAVQSISPPKGMSAARFENRRRPLDQIPVLKDSTA